VNFINERIVQAFYLGAEVPAMCQWLMRT